MATHTFYSTENHHNERAIRILSVGSLVSKPPTKEKRISIKARMMLSGSVNMGAPEWLDNALIYVSQHGDTITPDIEFKGYAIDFSVENLFGENVSSKNCIMRGFEITEQGSEEIPDVVLNFTMRMPFSTSLWQFLGQYVGDEAWARFTPGVVEEASAGEEDGTALDDGENDEEEGDDATKSEGDEDSSDTGNVVQMKNGKNGPKDLAAYHETQVQGEVKRGRGRPRKNPVDPLTVSEPVMAEQPF